jgi:hypothetical protein
MEDGFSKSEAAPQRRKYIKKQHSYETWNFLCHPKNVSKDLPVGKPDYVANKFSNGFDRRRVKNIQPAKTRLAFEAERTRRLDQVAKLRKAHINQQINKNGDIISHRHGPAQEKVRRGRKHVTLPAHTLKRMEIERNRTSLARFYGNTQNQNENLNANKKVNKYAQIKQTSSLIGYGRSDLPSQGVKDAFMYNQPLKEYKFKPSKRSEQTIKAKYLKKTNKD